VAEISGLSVFEEPLAFITAVLGVVLLTVARITLPKYIEKKTETELKKIESNERISLEENNRLVNNTNDTVGRIEGAVIELKNKYEEMAKSLQLQTQTTTRMSRQVDILSFYNPDLEVIDRLIAFNWCLKAGKNGKLFKDGSVLILHNKSTWMWILEHDKYKQPDNERYQTMLKKIEDTIFI
jgi:hypothetical protein